MALTEKYLNQLIADKTALANNLTTKGVTATSEETFTELVPKVLDIPTGATTPAKGFIINEFDEEGYATDVSIVGMTSLPDYAFNAYYSSETTLLNKRLKKLTLPEDLTVLGLNCFKNCEELESINLSDGITSIPSYAFATCINLALTSLPNDLTSIGQYAFYYCRNLALTTLPDSITSIGQYAFGECTNLELTSLPSTLTSIGKNAFASCTKLSTLILPNGLTTIGNGIFNNCSSLKEVTCLGNVTTIDTYSFNGTRLSKFVLSNVTSVPTLSNTSFNGTLIKSGTGYIYVPDALVEDFKVATNWSTLAAQIKGISELPTE